MDEEKISLCNDSIERKVFRVGCEEHVASVLCTTLATKTIDDLLLIGHKDHKFLIRSEYVEDDGQNRLNKPVCLRRSSSVKELFSYSVIGGARLASVQHDFRAV